MVPPVMHTGRGAARHGLSVAGVAVCVVLSLALALPARAEAAILKEIERIQREGVPKDELDRTRRQLHAQVVYSLEGVTNQGFALGFMDLVARGAAAWETFPEALQNVTSDDVQRVASKYLVEQQRTTGWFVPQNTSNNGEAR